MANITFAIARELYRSHCPPRNPRLAITKNKRILKSNPVKPDVKNFRLFGYYSDITTTFA